VLEFDIFDRGAPVAQLGELEPPIQATRLATEIGWAPGT
jgi:hypothetical protein